MDAIRDDEIEFFFAPPLPPQSGMVSPLHLLRREALLCWIGEVISEDLVAADPRRNRVFATGMVIMAGIDLLAKFYAGSDERTLVGARFKAFASEFIFGGGATATTLSAVLYDGLRNPLLHSFTLYSTKHTVALVQGFERGNVVREASGHPNMFIISSDDLFVSFIGAVKAYESKVRSSGDLKKKFEAMFYSYGRLEFQAFAR